MINESIIKSGSRWMDVNRGRKVTVIHDDGDKVMARFDNGKVVYWMTDYWLDHWQPVKEES